MPQQITLTPPPFLKLRLQLGTSIIALSVRMDALYEGMLEGLPNDITNQSIIHSHAAELNNAWGSTPIYVIPSEANRFSRSGGREAAILPPAQISALFTEVRAKDDFSPAKQLILIWHQHKVPPLISPEVKSLIQQLDWAALAKVEEEAEF